MKQIYWIYPRDKGRFLTVMLTTLVLMRSAINCGDAAALQSKGVSVGSGCLAGLPMKWWSALVVLGMLAAVLVLTRRYRRRRMHGVIG